jgi:hypothetical protein
MIMEKTKEAAREWIEAGKPCMYRYGYAWKGAATRPMTQEKALALLPLYSFGMGFYEISFTKYNGDDVLLFNEFSKSDMW